MAIWFDGNLLQHQKPKILEVRQVDSLNSLVVEQMWSLFLKMEYDFVVVIEVDDSSQRENDNGTECDEQNGNCQSAMEEC